jgi:hypothetical protein
MATGELASASRLTPFSAETCCPRVAVAKPSPLSRRPLSSAASTDWFDALCALDDELAAASAGQTTGVVAFIDIDSIVGASVGDSVAWLISRLPT